MKYSIIIPSLNEEKLLPNLLKQLTTNGFKDKFESEIIVSDGGSSDKTVELALKYADIVKVHNENKKQTIAVGKNIGADYADGDIFVFISSDVVLPDPARFFEYLEKNFVNSDYLAMTCFVKVFPEEEILSDKIFHGLYNRYFRLLNNLGIGMGRGECHIIKRETFETVGGYKNSLAAGEDFDLFKRIRKMGKILYAKDICVYESPRRFRKLGYPRVTWLWIKNGFSVFLKDKASSNEWEQVR